MKNKKEEILKETISICNVCLKKIGAKIVKIKNSVFILKECEKHGKQKELLEEYGELHSRKKEFDKPGNSIIPETKTKKGCPYDCGLCPEHKQHTCTALIEINKNCNLCCPTCYACSSIIKQKNLSLNKIEKMMDFFQKKEGGKAEILQISGGEPTIHPKILEIVAMAKRKNFRYLMLNTNGIRISEDENFVKELSKFRGRFEIYLQFDGFKKSTYKFFRGDENLLRIKLKAIEKLKKYKIPITLVATIQKGINDDEIGKIFDFGIKTYGIRGVNFQPIAFFGRVKKVETKERITLTGIIKRLEKQTRAKIKKEDIVPLPCDVHRVAVGYFYRDERRFISLTNFFKIKSYLPIIDNTLAFDADKILEDKKRFFCCCNLLNKFLNDFSKIIPKNYKEMSEEEQMEWWDKSSFRVTIMYFLDRFNFDIASAQKECVHFITPNLKRIPFSTYNILHRKV